MPFPIDEYYIKETESSLRIRFPESYRAKMMKENGGKVFTDDDDWQLHPILDKTDKKRISRTCNDVVKETKNAAEWDGFPKEGIAIGNNGSGDYLIFMRNAEGNIAGPSLFIWNHETREVREIAKDFSELEKT